MVLIEAFLLFISKKGQTLNYINKFNNFCCQRLIIYENEKDKRKKLKKNNGLALYEVQRGLYK